MSKSKYERVKLDTHIQTEVRLGRPMVWGRDKYNRIGFKYIRKTKKKMIRTGVVKKFMQLIQRSNLSQREKDILCMRLDHYTLREISVKQGVTKERIRQIEEKATRKLRHLLK